MTNTTTRETVEADREVAIRNLERALNVALVTFGYNNQRLRFALFEARAHIRAALEGGE